MGNLHLYVELGLNYLWLERRKDYHNCWSKLGRVRIKEHSSCKCVEVHRHGVSVLEIINNLSITRIKHLSQNHINLYIYKISFSWELRTKLFNVLRIGLEKHIWMDRILRLLLSCHCCLDLKVIFLKDKMDHYEYKFTISFNQSTGARTLFIKD